MANTLSATRYHQPAAPLIWMMRLLAAAAIGLAAILLVHATQSIGLPGCGQRSGCDTVLNSPWSKIGSIPSAAPAIGVYAIILVSLFRLKQRIGWWLLLLASTITVGASVWFIFVQFTFLGAWCKYCMTIHVCGGVIALSAWTTAPLGRLRVLPDDPPDAMMIAPTRAALIIAMALASVAVLATVQTVFPAPTTRISLLDDTVRLDVRNFPTLGNPGATVVLGELLDYTCPHCKKLHGHLREARKRYHNQFTIVALPAPLDADCNQYIERNEPIHDDACELASLALAVWQVDPSKFADFHDWLFDHQGKLTVVQARAHAGELVGVPTLAATLTDPAIAQRLVKNIGLHHHLGGGLPKLLFENIRIDGRPQTAAELFDLLEQNTPLRNNGE